jgi:hypothetical protein
MSTGTTPNEDKTTNHSANTDGNLTPSLNTPPPLQGSHRAQVAKLTTMWAMNELRMWDNENNTIREEETSMNKLDMEEGEMEELTMEQYKEREVLENRKMEEQLMEQHKEVVMEKEEPVKQKEEMDQKK